MVIKQKGSFSVELALVLVFFSSFLAIHINYTIAINKKGQLDRATYSLLSLLSERKQFYSGEINMCGFNGTHCNSEIKKVFDIAKNSMKRMVPSFDESELGLKVTQVSISSEDKLIVNSETSGNVDKCEFMDFSKMNLTKAKQLLPTTTRNRRLPMYHLSLCYVTPFNIIGAVRGDPMRIVSSSYAFARI
ncbi:pilus assembly protein TadF [Vibrio genomosp. F6]|uniref:tight adherence pilus pseudopilin TadF n=1 Tax=Vibrio genomosp. F6 TaxID=723172 RepID=UPI0010BDB7F4|nr:tight adherence pilus pseudopilin TadF [Vibrio genomosp. F6]TKF17891.1 pilus assembly protein TadF [Vibrio genomosp. F6]